MEKQIKTILIILSLLSMLVSINPVSAEQLPDREILPNGIILLHSEKKTLPIVKVEVAVKAGSVAETSGKAGLSNLTADLLNEGTMKRSSKDISEAIEFAGGGLSTSGSYDYISISLSVLKKDLELGFDLLSDIIINPAFTDDEINRRRKIIKDYIKQQNEEPGVVAAKAFMKEIFKDHPYGWPVEGTEESLDNIVRNDIVEFHKAYFAPNNTIMAVVGDVSKQEITALVNKYFKDWKTKDIKKGDLPSLAFQKKPQILKINKSLTQASIILGHLGISRDNPDYYAVLVMNYILGGGGFSSRLMDNIRDNKGLSYHVDSHFFANKYAGSFRAALKTKTRSANTAIAEIIMEIERIRTEPVSDQELNDAKSYLTGSFPLRIDTNNKLAALSVAVEFYDLGLDYIDKYKRLVNAVTKNDILRVAGKYLDPRNYTLVLVGDIEKADLKY